MLAFNSTSCRLNQNYKISIVVILLLLGNLKLILMSTKSMQESMLTPSVQSSTDPRVLTSHIPKSKARLCREDEKKKDYVYKYQGQNQEDLELVSKN